MEVMCPLCDQLITIPSSRKVVPPPPPKSSTPVAPVPAKEKEKAPAGAATRPKVNPVVPPPLEKAVKDSKPAHEGTAAKERAPQPKAPNSEGRPTGDASQSGEKSSPKPIPKPRSLLEQQVSSPAKPPGPPPRKNVTPVKNGSDSHSTAKVQHERDSSQSDEEKQTPVPPPLKRESKSQPFQAAPQHPPPPPPERSGPGKASPVAPAKAPPATAPTASPSANASPGPEPEPREVVRGVEHDPGKKWTVYQLGACLAILACVGMIPGILEVVRHTQDFDSRGIERFAYFVFFFSGIQLIYAIYMVQLPDWSTARVVMVVSAMVSVLYAISMGVALMAGNDNAIIAAFGLSAQQSAGYVSMWCCMMTLLMSLLTYFLVRTSLRWQRAYELATAGR